jgi:hypothetical protein
MDLHQPDSGPAGAGAMRQDLVRPALAVELQRSAFQVVHGNAAVRHLVDADVGGQLGLRKPGSAQLLGLPRLRLVLREQHCRQSGGE